MSASFVKRLIVALSLANIITFIVAICKAHGWLFPREMHFSTEFMSFYCAGLLVNAGHATSIYDPGTPIAPYIHSLYGTPAHSHLQQTLSGDPKILIFTFFYPPVTWLFYAPIARLPFYPAMLLWSCSTLCLFLVAIKKITGSWRCCLPLLGYLAFYENLGVGENAFFIGGVLGFGLLYLEDQPWLAGMILGWLCFKPHYLLPVGFLLLCLKDRRPLIALVTSSAAICLFSAGVFGTRVWMDYFQIVIPHAEWMATHRGFFYNVQVSMFATVRMLGGSLLISNAMQAISYTITMIALYIAGRRASPLIRAAILTASLPLALSFMLDYDLLISGLSIVFLVAEVQATGYRSYEKTAAMCMYLLPLIVWVFRTKMYVPIDPLVSLCFVGLLCRRALSGRPLFVRAST